MKSYCIFLVSALFASSEAFVLPSASSITTTQLSAQTSSSRAEFLRDVAATSIASVIVSLPGVATADDAEDLAMPTAEEQKAQDVSKAISIAAMQLSIKTTLILDATSLFGIKYHVHLACPGTARKRGKHASA